MTGQAITRDEAKLMLLAVAKQHADAGNAWQAASIVAAVDALAEPAPAIDLEQFREPVEHYRQSWAGFAETMRKAGRSDVSANGKVANCDRLLALIDGQANVRSSSEHCSEVTTDLVTDDAVRRLVRAMENTPGDDLIEPNTRLCRRLLTAALQPTKGEGVAHD